MAWKCCDECKGKGYEEYWPPTNGYLDTRIGNHYKERVQCTPCSGKGGIYIEEPKQTEARTFKPYLDEILTQTQIDDLRVRLSAAYMTSRGMSLEPADVAYIWAKFGGSL